MKGLETELNGCWVIEPDVFEDERGYFFEGFNSSKFKDLTGADFTGANLSNAIYDDNLTQSQLDVLI